MLLERDRYGVIHLAQRRSERFPVTDAQQTWFQQRSKFLCAFRGERRIPQEQSRENGNTTLNTPAASRPVWVVKESPAIRELSRRSKKAMRPGV
jgi:hypothetical protein